MPALPPELHSQAAKLDATGMPRTEIARRLGVAHGTVYLWLGPRNPTAERVTKGRGLLRCEVCSEPLVTHSIDGSCAPTRAPERAAVWSGRLRVEADF
jgi:hypothetical protein